mmetsp:Transcript_61818/g.133971  ORF Transcript_61818/g.133971 Transcript_61818/m.133971 type:complete len:223 (-) Transcript_61818:1620-2288(-)
MLNCTEPLLSGSSSSWPPARTGRSVTSVVIMFMSLATFSRYFRMSRLTEPMKVSPATKPLSKTLISMVQDLVGMTILGKTMRQLNVALPSVLLLCTSVYCTLGKPFLAPSYSSHSRSTATLTSTWSPSTILMSFVVQMTRRTSMLKGTGGRSSTGFRSEASTLSIISTHISRLPQFCPTLSGLKSGRFSMGILPRASAFRQLSECHRSSRSRTVAPMRVSVI